MAASQPVLVPAVSTSTPRRLPANVEVWLVSAGLIVAAARAGISEALGASWIIVLLALGTFMLFLGKWISGRPLGILVNERNIMSLSRFQMILWTLLILSAYVTMVMQRVHAGIVHPLDIGVDWRLWALMGISTASLVGSPLLVQQKATQDLSPSAIDKAANLLKEDKNAIQENRQGKLYSNADVKDARFTDIFQGDEVGNTAYIDPAKLQMFVFTLAVAVTYGYSIFRAMHSGPDQLCLPPVSDGMVALLGISHAGYLGSKAMN